MEPKVRPKFWNLSFYEISEMTLPRFARYGSLEYSEARNLRN